MGCYPNSSTHGQQQLPSQPHETHIWPIPCPWWGPQSCKQVTTGQPHSSSPKEHLPSSSCPSPSTWDPVPVSSAPCSLSLDIVFSSCPLASPSSGHYHFHLDQSLLGFLTNNSVPSTLPESVFLFCMSLWVIQVDLQG